MSNISVLIAAGGMGTRSGLSHPKTLYPINGRPILHRLHSLFHNYDKCPKIIVSPEGKSSIREFLRLNSLGAELIIQKNLRAWAMQFCNQDNRAILLIIANI